MLFHDKTVGVERSARQAANKIIGRTLLLFILFFTVIIAAACGNNAGSNTAGADSSTANQATASPSAGKTSESQTQTVKHVLGTTEVPAHPKRVAVHGLEDIMLALKAPMVYAYSVDGHYLSAQLKELKVPTFNTWEPNLEAILSQQPDLILINKNAVDPKSYAELSKIAPTVALDAGEWRTSIVTIGSILGLADQAQAVIKAHDEKIGQAKAAIAGAVGADKTVAYIRPSDKELQLFFPSFNLVYRDLGLKPDASVIDYQKQTADDWGMNLSLEKLPTITADYVFAIYGYSLETEAEFQQHVAASKEIEKLQVWKAMPAVQQNHLFKVSARHWISAGPIAESREIDDVVAAITGKK
ncbi:ABC transporter substrate-binding protein [Paenibacillus thalictri]|uniref:ABC transporter substrate-binding protein n=1 Tax=Paenibacillus thalictri TaxID=2527873 RepID=A0A4Q9DIE0_9BACL|nr:ABC transporter substrate-binding protein [Paenibacillus thalictri]TBL70402.1 ABC transporter substrate-binding protein [Paenibacillus thalictri]